MGVPNGYYRGAGGWLYLIADDSGPYCMDPQGGIWNPAYTGLGSVVPNVWKSFSNLTLLTPQTLWTPAAGKSFLLMGFNISTTVIGGVAQLLDSAAAILTLPFVLVNQNIADSLGNGILSAAPNNVLKISGAVTQIVSGYVFGREQ